MEDKLICYLKNFIKIERYERMTSVLRQRSEYLTVVLEDIHYSQNASAIIRHCDAFGIQNIHIIENKNKFTLKNHAVRGTLKWITLNRHNQNNDNSREAVSSLKSKGYRIIATSPEKGGSIPADFNLKKGKAAIFFGNERDGLSNYILENADEHIHIPMEGFVESLNISASCAIILQRLSERLRNSEINWSISDIEKEKILLQWLRESIKKSSQLEKSFNLLNYK